MFCPRCSQQQVSEEVRFCSRCGLPLDGVSLLLSNEGALPGLPASGELPPPSPRLKGVRQGGLIIILGIFFVPFLVFLTEELRVLPERVAILAALVFFLGGFLRLILALLFEDGPLRRKRQPALPARPVNASPHAIPAWGKRDQAALPPPQSIPTSAYVSPRANTAEMAERPQSVTENTTRLLDDERS